MNKTRREILDRVGGLSDEQLAEVLDKLTLFINMMASVGEKLEFHRELRSAVRSEMQRRAVLDTACEAQEQVDADELERFALEHTGEPNRFKLRTVH